MYKQNMYKIFFLCSSVIFSQNIQDLQKIQREYEKITRQNMQNLPSSGNIIEDVSLSPDIVRLPVRNFNEVSDST